MWKQIPKGSGKKQQDLKTNTIKQEQLKNKKDQTTKAQLQRNLEKEQQPTT